MIVHPLNKDRSMASENNLLRERLSSPYSPPILPGSLGFLGVNSRVLQSLLAARLAELESSTRQCIPQTPSSLLMLLQANPAIYDVPKSPPSGLNLLRSVSLTVSPNEVTPSDTPRRVSLPATPELTGQVAFGTSDNTAASSVASVADSLGGRNDSKGNKKAGKTKCFINEIKEWDVLCGRGGKSNHHTGNKRYRQVVSDMKSIYRDTETKTLKTDLSRAIVDHVCGYGARFVKMDEKTGRYYVLTKAEARRKTSQALRETKELKWTA